MQESGSSLENQVQELNQYLKVLIKRKSPAYLFLSGALHSLGSVFGTVVVLGILGFLASQVFRNFDFTKITADWVSNILKTVNEH
ncbi:MAG: hypothetical protein ABIB61_00960 [Candidatus Shapirobacteria bacterium]